MVLTAMFFVIFGGFIVLAATLAGILTLGIILLIIGLISRYLNKKKDIKKKYAKICITLGSIFTVIPLVILGVILVTYVIDSKNGEYNPYTYNPHESNSLQDEEYCKEIMTEVIRCLDGNDIEGLKNMFSDYAMELSDLESQIEQAMEIYEGSTVTCSDYVYSSGGGHVEYGYYHSKGGRYEAKVVTDTGAEYIVEIVIVLVDDEEREKEGIEQIIIHDYKNQNEPLIKIGKLYG